MRGSPRDSAWSQLRRRESGRRVSIRSELATLGEDSPSPPYHEGRHRVKQRPRNPDREERIYQEILVDTNGPEEQAMGWYYYLEKVLRFPFEARCIAPKVVSPYSPGPIAPGEMVIIFGSGLGPTQLVSRNSTHKVESRSKCALAPSAGLVMRSPKRGRVIPPRR
jgi:hypothetical protein